MTTYNNMNANISVIIPFYSNIDWLKEAVDSVFNQTYKNFEIIVVNDGSKEDDTNFVEDYDDKIIYKKTKNAGPAAARNFGIELAQGEFIAFLDSDDLWMPEKLELQLKHMQNNDLFWSHTGYELFNDADGKTFKTVTVNHFHGSVFLRCLTSSPIATPCVMIKTKFLRDNPEIRFAKNMRFGQDGFMWLNMARHKNLGIIDQSLSKVRIRGGNAALRARVHLQVKAQIWEFIREKTKVDDKFQTIPFFIKLAYKSSYNGNKIISFFEKRNWLNKKVLEFFSKILYVPSYIILRIYSNKYN